MSTDEEVIQTVGKFQFVRGYPPAAPSKCVSCGAFSGDFIDFGFSLDYYGAVYFCRSCFTEGCHLFGYHSDEKMTVLAKELGEANSKNLDLIIQIEELKNALAATDLVSRFVSSAKPADVPTMEDVQPTGTEPAPTNKSDSRREKGSSKSGNESGSSGVSNDDTSLTDVIGSI